ncbi:UDP-glycosyltransferase 92A1-like [Typha angustifolia]|uniref:UDP-glycosyltransferase 92A1-like n=1 Tax=Typha angustifolia TaxID=59011 RepID=UPI003C2FEB50
MADNYPHVILFPFLAQGHINPFLSLATHLHSQHPSLTITLVSTPLNIQSIRSSLPPTSSLRLHSLPFSPADFGLPAYAESIAALSFHQFLTFFNASDSLLPAFEDFVADIAGKAIAPVCIITDIFFAWTVDVARKHKVYHSAFNTSSAYGSAIFCSLWTHLPHRNTTSDEFSLSDHPEVVIHRSQLTNHLLNADGNDGWSAALRPRLSAWYESDSMLVNTVEEFESTGLNMLRKTLGIPVWPIGPLTSISSSSEHDNEIITWLDSQKPASVLYISFGSQNTIQAHQMMELAMGLDLSNRPFIWVIRPPEGFDKKGEFRAEWLPPGFEERIKREKRGILVHGWAPQATILAHESLGAFLSHCGWNSLLESLCCGIPIIAWPLSADQLYNAKMMAEEWGLCVEVARGKLAKLKKEKVVEVVEIVMGENERGKEVKRRAMEIKESMSMAWKEGSEGSSSKGLREFLEAAGLLV